MPRTLPVAPTSGAYIDTGADRYIWNGFAWNNVGSSPIVAVEYGEAVLGTNVSIPAGTAGVHGTTVITFTLPSAGTWRITSIVQAYGGATSNAAFAIYDGSGTLIPNSQFMGMHTNTGVIGVAASGVSYLTVSGATTCTLRAGAWSGASNALSNSANGLTKVSYEKISANVASYYQAGAMIDAGTVTINAQTTAPTKGTVVRDVVRYRDLGSKVYDVEYSFCQSTAGTAGAGWYLFVLPAGLQFNTTKHPTNQSAVGDAAAWGAAIPDCSAKCIHIASNMHSAIVIPWDATRFRVLGTSGTVNSQNFAGSTWYSMNLAIAYQFAFSFQAV